jgi:hypothetical protein
MNNDIDKDLSDFFNRAILESTTYSGNKIKQKKILSASQINNDDLPLYLKYMYGLNKKEPQYGQNTIGSIYQLGCDKIFENKVGEIAKRLELKLKNEWLLSGELDHLIPFEYNGDTHYVIVDNKLVKYAKLDEILKKGDKHDYSLQVRIYKYLLHVVMGIDNDKIHTYLFLAFKDGSWFTKSIIPNYKLLKINNTLNDKELEQLFYDKTNRMDYYFDNNEIPDKCKNLFWRAAEKPAKPMRCLKFCDVSEHCSYNNKYTKGRNKNHINKLAGL